MSNMTFRLIMDSKKLLSSIVRQTSLLRHFTLHAQPC